jgi:hypothetical protein
VWCHSGSLKSFSDGQSFKGSAGYVEAGYSITETIAAGKIKTEYDHLG